MPQLQADQGGPAGRKEEQLVQHQTLTHTAANTWQPSPAPLQGLNTYTTPRGGPTDTCSSKDSVWKTLL